MYGHYTQRQISDVNFRLSLRSRHCPYFVKLQQARSLGYKRNEHGQGSWVARIYLKNNRHKMHTIGLADDIKIADAGSILTFTQAEVLARAWFSRPEISAIAADTQQLGPCDQLSYCPIGNVYTVAHALWDLVEWRRNFRSRSNLYSSISMINRYILPVLGQKPISDLQPTDLRSLLLTIEATPRSGRSRQPKPLVDPNTMDPDKRRKRRITANNTVSILRSALNMAWRENKAPGDRFWQYVRAFPHIEFNRPFILSWEQCKRLVDEAPSDLRQLILAALYTGCRIGEIFQIRAADIMPSRKAIYVRPQKTHKGRTVALPDEGYEWFRQLVGNKSGEAQLFLRQDGSAWKLPWSATLFRRLSRRLALPEGLVFHSLRHTYASLLLQSGTSPIVVARQLGHASMETVIRTYAHVTDDFIDEEFRKRFRPGFLKPKGIE